MIIGRSRPRHDRARGDRRGSPRWSRRLLRTRAVLEIYLARLRTHIVQEALAAIGIAIGVALVFAVQVSNSSVPASSDEISRSVSGAAQLQVAARDARGFSMRLLDQVRATDGVERAAPLLEQRAVIAGPNGRDVAITLASADPSLAALSGALSSSFPSGALLRDGIMLPTAVNAALGLPDRATQAVLRPEPKVDVSLRGRRFEIPVTAVLSRDSIGPLADARVAVAPLGYVQRLAGLPDRANRILVEAENGQVDAVKAQLAQLVGSRLSVTNVDADSRLLDEALRPNNQAAAFFAGVALLVGLLLAFNAMLLTAPERRRVIAEMRLMRFRNTQIIQTFVAQALILGVTASALGLVAGNVLARTVLHAQPDYLASVFPIGSQTIVSARAVLVAFAGGLLVTLLAALPPLFELRKRRLDGGDVAHVSEAGQAMTPQTRRRLLVAGLGLLLVTNAMLLVTPSAAFVAGLGLAVSTLLLIPSAFAAMLTLCARLSDNSRALTPLATAVLELRSTTVRALALAAVGAAAVFGSVALEGGHRDLLRGLYDGYERYAGTADIWIVHPRDDLATKDIRAGQIEQQVAAIAGVASVRPYFGSFIDLESAQRRAWVIGRPRGDRAMIPAGQLVDGDEVVAERRLREGGWITVSDQVADALGTGVGEAVTIPTPSGARRFTIAATTTNLGWTSGAIILNATDYSRAWGTSDPSAFEVNVAPGAATSAVRQDIAYALGRTTGLLVQTSEQRSAQANALARQGLRRLTEISLLLLIAAALAMAAAMGTSIWQRRPRLASMRLQGFKPKQLWRILLLESGLVLATGCLVGATLGVWGQWLIDRWLRRTTGFPAIFAFDATQTILLVAGVLVLALAIVACTAWSASRAPKRLGY